jgi:hypothetical protein
MSAPPEEDGTRGPKTLLNLGNLPPKQQGFGQSLVSQQRGGLVVDITHVPLMLNVFFLSHFYIQYPRTPSRVDPNNPPWPAYRGYHEYSFAHATMGVRLPTILGKAIDDTVKTLNTQVSQSGGASYRKTGVMVSGLISLFIVEQSAEEKMIDLNACIERMEDLMDDLQKNHKLRPIVDDGEGGLCYVLFLFSSVGRGLLMLWMNSCRYPSLEQGKWNDRAAELLLSASVLTS